MLSTLVLKTEGYQVSFELTTTDRIDEFDTIINFLLNPRLGTVSFTSFPAIITINTLKELITYFEQHIEQIQIKPFSKSNTFFPLNFLFKLQALEGEINAPDDGDFSLRFMMDMHQPGADPAAVYIGGEAVIFLKDVNRFLSSVKQLLAEALYEQK